MRRKGCGGTWQTVLSPPVQALVAIPWHGLQGVDRVAVVVVAVAVAAGEELSTVWRKFYFNKREKEREERRGSEQVREEEWKRGSERGRERARKRGCGAGPIFILIIMSRDCAHERIPLDGEGEKQKKKNSSFGGFVVGGGRASTSTHASIDSMASNAEHNTQETPVGEYQKRPSAVFELGERTKGLCFGIQATNLAVTFRASTVLWALRTPLRRVLARHKGDAMLQPTHAETQTNTLARSLRLVVVLFACLRGTRALRHPSQ
jgi:hypothetical protein